MYPTLQNLLGQSAQARVQMNIPASWLTTGLYVLSIHIMKQASKQVIIYDERVSQGS